MRGADRLRQLVVGRRALSTFGRSAKAVRHVQLLDPLPLELGGALPGGVTVAYEEWGPRHSSKVQRPSVVPPLTSHTRAQVVLLFPSFSMSSHARSTSEDPKHGWFEGFVGPHRAIDTDTYRVICPANLGAPFGTTSPLSIDPGACAVDRRAALPLKGGALRGVAATGEPYGPSFPQITPADIARVAR